MIYFLVGYMGAGKSSVGRHVAKKLNVGFIDMDERIVEAEGRSIDEIFQQDGEAYFREAETAVLAELGEDVVVVSTGGGVPLSEQNRELMMKRGRMVYLKSSPEELVKQLERGRDKRPKIRGMSDGELLEYINRELPKREEWYGMADWVIDCDGKDFFEVCREFASIVKTDKRDEK